MTKILGLVGQFQKFKRRPIELFSLSVAYETEGWPRGTTRVALDHYDVNHSKKYGYIFDMSGSGGNEVHVSGLYFLRGKIAIKETPCTLIDPKDEPPWESGATVALREVNRTRRLPRLPSKFRGDGNLWEWLGGNAIESGSMWCSICADWFPDDSICQHCWWCEQASWWSTPSERCGCPVRAFCDGDDLAERAAFGPEHPKMLDCRW